MVRALACAALCAFACTKADRPAPARIVVGATMPFTGAEKQSARFYREGYDTAFEEVNRAGGVRLQGRRVPLVLELADDGGDPMLGAAEARALLAQKGASFLLGSAAIEVVGAQAAVAESERVPLIAAGPLPQGRYSFSVEAPAGALAEAELRFIDAQNLPPPVSLALLVEQSARGDDFKSAVHRFVDEHDSFHIVHEESFGKEPQTFIGPLTRVQAAHADALLALAPLSQFLALHRRYRWMGLCHKVLSYGPHGGEPEALEEFQFDGLAYLVEPVFWTARLGGNGTTRQFMRLFKDETYHRDPDWYGALAYESARALFAAIRAAGSADREAVRAKLETLEMESIVPGGRLRFGRAHRAEYPVVVQQTLPDGRAPIVFPAAFAEAAAVAPNPGCR